MTGSEETPEYSEDDDDIEILRQVLSVLKKAGYSDINAIGPVREDRVPVTVPFKPSGAAPLPDAVEVRLPSGKSVTLKLVVTRDERRPRLLGGPVPPPLQYSGPLMGGDPVWNDVATQWGTISFAAPAGSGITVEGMDCAGRILTCNHVLDFPRSATASTPHFPQSMYLKWNIVPPVGTKWIDLAGADIDASVPYKALETRGLGAITGVRRSRKGDRVSKYGATTGLTSGRDLGWGWRATTSDPTPYLVKVVSGYFGAEGDSGAPVLDADRNLVGLVVSGIPGSIDETYFMQASRTPSGPLGLDRSRFVVSGF